MQVKLQSQNENEITAAPSPVSVAASAPKFHPVTGAAGSENANMTNHFDSIPVDAQIFAVDCGHGSAPILNGDIIHDHDNGCWKFLSIVQAPRVSDCRITARHTVSGKVVTTSPTAFNLRIVWEVEN